MNKRLELRSCCEEDLKEIVEIQRDILNGHLAPNWIDLVRLQLGKPEGVSLVAVREGRVIGFFCGQVKHGDFGLEHSGWIEMFGVNPKYMGHGVGQALARAAFDCFREQGVTDIYTAVAWDSGDLSAFFQSIGFSRSSFISLRRKLD